MTRPRPPLWLSSPGRFAGLRPATALVLLLACIALLLTSWMQPVEDPGTRAGGQGDLGLYGAVVDGLRRGGDYYGVVATEFRAAGYPLRPFTAVRLPTLTVIQAALPDTVSVVLLVLIAAATGFAWTRRIGDWFGRGPPRVTALFLLAGGMVAFVQPALVHFHELWAGLLVAWSLAIRRADRWIEAVALALCAMLIRETAALYAIVMLVAALIERQRREALAWGAILLLFVAILSLHARAIAMVAGPLDITVAAWGGWHGPALFASGMARSTALTMLPWWLGAPLAIIALVGWAAAPGPVGARAAATFSVVALLIAAFARTDSFHWVLVVAPAYLVGMAFLPDASRDLTRTLLDRRRVRVQRITR